VTDAAADRWLLTPAERGNPDTDLDSAANSGPGSEGHSWSAGNLVRPLVHGGPYFRRLYDELCALTVGDRLYFTDWRGDADEQLTEAGHTIAEVLCELARAGVEVRGLLWRSHSDLLRFNAQENQRLGTELNDAGAEVLLDERVRRFGSHHQKLFVVQHREARDRDVAFVGGIDLCHGRRDDAAHHGDPQAPAMDRRFGRRPPWHDAALELRGPVVGDLLRTFGERWDDPHPLDRRTPYRMLMQRLARMPRHPRSLPDRFPAPDPTGPQAVQVLRTYGTKRPGYPFARNGERSIAHAYEKAFSLARSLIYVEDQYLWNEVIAQSIAEALQRSPELRLVAVLPRYPDADGRVSGPPTRLGQWRALDLLRRTAPDRVVVVDLENADGVPIYVHAKICVVDDVWFTCGSDNFNVRSWTNDSEVTCAVVDETRDEREPADLSAHGDGARRLARELRLQLWSEHLGVPADDKRLLDPVEGVELWRRTAEALDAWHTGGQRGQRPPGQVRRHEPESLSRNQQRWAPLLYRTLFDPDGRPRRLRGTRRF
jgi:phosphatidylserine/phosphatidylglycerophosphate/cardiolipin synthase-like enzyme